MTMPIDPSGVEAGLSLGYRVVKAIARNARVSVFAFGAENTGKTSFIRWLERRGTLAEIFGASRSTGVIPHTINVNPYPAQQPATVKLKIIDSGGHRRFGRVRRAELADSLPLGILLFLDHNATGSKGRYNEQVDNGDMNPQRMDRHHAIFQELRDILHDNAKLRKLCNALVICISKYDLWRDKVEVDEFFHEFEADIETLMNISGIRNIPPLIPYSTLTGEGIYEILRMLFKLSGWEIPLFWTIRIRIKSGLLR